jgi:hypothetical protein
VEVYARCDVNAGGDRLMIERACDWLFVCKTCVANTENSREIVTRIVKITSAIDQKVNVHEENRRHYILVGSDRSFLRGDRKIVTDGCVT